MTKTFFIADTHFNHEDCIQFDHRPFRDATHMWYHMRDSWNKAIDKNDTVYILGDMFWSREPDLAAHLLKQLNGHKRLIKGNHDQFLKNTAVKLQFQVIRDYEEVEVDGKRLILSHFPLASWKYMKGLSDDREEAYIHLHGHVHMSQEFYDYQKCLEIMNGTGKVPLKAYNVGCMCPWMNYVPRTVEEIEKGVKHWHDLLHK